MIDRKQYNEYLETRSKSISLEQKIHSYKQEAGKFYGWK